MSRLAAKTRLQTHASCETPSWPSNPFFSRCAENPSDRFLTIRPSTSLEIYESLHMVLISLRARASVVRAARWFTQSVGMAIRPTGR